MRRGDGWKGRRAYNDTPVQKQSKNMPVDTSQGWAGSTPEAKARSPSTRLPAHSSHTALFKVAQKDKKSWVFAVVRTPLNGQMLGPDDLDHWARLTGPLAIKSTQGVQP